MGNSKNLVGSIYFPYAKGGGHSKYANNIIDYVLWENNGEKIKNFKKSVIRNEGYYFKEAITYSDITSGNMFSARYLPINHIFDVKVLVFFLKI